MLDGVMAAFNKEDMAVNKGLVENVIANMAKRNKAYSGQASRAAGGRGGIFIFTRLVD